jgi:hypothetical protein
MIRRKARLDFHNNRRPQVALPSHHELSNFPYTHADTKPSGTREMRFSPADNPLRIMVDFLGPQAASPTLFSPFNEPRLSASPWDLLRMRTKPVTGPSSPSFSMLRFASASSPLTKLVIVGRRILGAHQKRFVHISWRSKIGSRLSGTLLVSGSSCSCRP